MCSDVCTSVANMHPEGLASKEAVRMVLLALGFSAATLLGAELVCCYAPPSRSKVGAGCWLIQEPSSLLPSKRANGQQGL